MRKKLTAIGNSLGIIIERPILELLGIDKDTPLEVKTDGEALVIRPVRMGHRSRVCEATNQMMDVPEAPRRKRAK